jgi:hypothetical protein
MPDESGIAAATAGSYMCSSTISTILPFSVSEAHNGKTTQVLR